MKKQEQSLFFVDVAGSHDLQKELLESSKDLVEILKNYERFKAINKEKKKEIQNLKAKISEISRLSSRIKTAIPLLKMKDMPTKLRPRATERVSQKTVSEIEDLEDELKEIEAKLNILG